MTVTPPARLETCPLILTWPEPWLIFAAVALQSDSDICFHRLMLCRLELPLGQGSVQCPEKLPVRFSKADEISESHRAAGRLANVHQKNWSPFVLGEELYLTFTLEPFTVLRVDPSTGICKEVSSVPVPALAVFHAASRGEEHSTLGVHGGSPYLRLPAGGLGGPYPADGFGREEFLGIGRIARGNTRYALFFFTFGPRSTHIGSAPRRRAGPDPARFEVLRVSPVLCFASTSPSHRGLCETIQFSGGVMLDGAGRAGSSLVVSYGANDCEAKIAFLPLSRVAALLRPASAR